MDLCPNCEKRMVAKGEQFCSPKCAVEYERTIEILKTRVRMRSYKPSPGSVEDQTQPGKES